MRDHIKGDTFEGVQFTLINSTTATPIDLTSATIRVQFRKKKITWSLIKEITTTSGVTITDAVNGVFVIDSFILDWVEDRYYYDVEVTFPSGLIKTYIKGSIYIAQDITT